MKTDEITIPHPKNRKVNKTKQINFYIKKFLIILVLLWKFSLYSFDNQKVEILNLVIVQTYPHDTNAFTQGLVFYQNKLYESTGLYGQSCLKEINPSTGQTIQKYLLPRHLFAEGITLNHQELIQLTWKEGIALIYQINPIRLIRQITYEGEGWGLCYDKEDDSFYMSNGSSELVKRHPRDFTIEKTIPVTWNGQPVKFLNDLICVEKYIYANVWNADYIIRLDKKTGIVNGIINASQLLPKKIKQSLGYESVLNGIAYNELTHTFYLTGKLWPYLYEVKFETVP
ncbi:glutaminyl-peptide cyclotransferase [Candidatus Protochlamydia sp. R18]|uniref:glutaminyl-peptide cyclotransferase n=1 Tax=Candidatus Protochlamydia sp. R18 TaxID=1353977 RepID=UPI000695011B|nr:glutaminyl-peptide cyclotransferase [Candidatus Protochlamydia sp. R18]